QRRVLLVAACRPHGTGDVVAAAEAELAGLLHRHVAVVATRQVAARAQEAVALGAEVEQSLHLDRLARVGLLGAILALAALLLLLLRTAVVAGSAGALAIAVPPATSTATAVAGLGVLVPRSATLLLAAALVARLTGLA